MEESVAQALGLGVGEFAGQQQPLGPGDQVVSETDELEPDTVVLEVAKRQVPEAGVLVVADVVFDPRATSFSSSGRRISACQSCCVRPCWIGIATTSSRPFRWGRMKSVAFETPTAC